MKNRKLLMALIALVAICMYAVALTSCGLLGGDTGNPNDGTHTHELTEVAEAAATCTTAGTKAYYQCSDCEKLFADKDGAKEITAPEAIEALGHSFTSYTSNNDATCKADGTKSAKCDRCDEIDTVADADSKLDHTYDQNNTALADALKSAATCESAAVYYKSCSCGAISDSLTFEDGTALGHDYTEKVADAAHLKAAGADCQTKNTYWYDCSRCASISDELFFDGEEVGKHKVSSDWTTKDGKHFHECTVDGCDYTEGDADCSDVDTDADHKCDVCSADNVSGHVYGAWANAGENHEKTCNCGDKVTEAHAWGDGVVTTNPTHTATGVKTYTCECLATKTETLDKLTDHNYDQEKVADKYLKSAATCTSAAVYYKSCICGEFSTDADTFNNGDPIAHSFVNENTELEGALKSAATCDNAAVYYKSCSCGAISDNETFVSGTSLGHNYGEASYVWSEDNTTCTATRVCANDETHVETETAKASVDTTDATCTVAGNTQYTATFTTSNFSVQSKDVAIEATGHAEKLVVEGAKTEYTVGDYFDTTNLVVSVACENCDVVETINDYVISKEENLQLEDKEIIVSCNVNNKTITAKIDITVTVPVFTISVTGGSSSASSVLEGETVTLTASTPEGKRHIGWKGILDGDAVYESNTFVMPNKSLTITAVFEDLAEGESKVVFSQSYSWDASATVNTSNNVEIGVESANRYPFPGSSGANKYLRIRGSNIILTDNSYSVAYTLRNSGELSISFTVAWEDYGTEHISEVITLAAGETKTIEVLYPKTVTQGEAPYIIIKLTQAIGATTADVVNLDVYAYKKLVDLSSQGYYSVMVNGDVGTTNTAVAEPGETIYLSAPTYDNKLLAGWSGINDDGSLFVGTCFIMPARDLSIAPVYVDVDESSVSTEGAKLTFGAATENGGSFVLTGTNGSYSTTANVLGNKLLNIEMSGVDFTSGPKKIVYTIKFDNVTEKKKFLIGMLYGESEYITSDSTLTAKGTEITITQILPEFTAIEGIDPIVRIVIPNSNPWGKQAAFTISAVVYDIVE